MKKILMAAALGMLLSMVCMALGADTEAGVVEGSPAALDPAGAEGSAVFVEPSATPEKGVVGTAAALSTVLDKAAKSRDEEDKALNRVVTELKSTLEKITKATAPAQPEAVPDWVIDPGKLQEVLKAAKLENQLFVGVGSGKNSRDYQAIQMAEARARQDIAFQREAYIKAEITDYSKSVEGTKNESASSSVTAAEDYIVGQQSVEYRLPNAKVALRVKDPGSGTWWVVVAAMRPDAPIAPPAPLAEVGPYTHNAEAMEAVKLMDDRLEKNRLKATVSPVVSSEAVSE
jgi:hypothetical protein